MDFVLTKAGQILQQPGADATACMSAARAIVEVCEVAQSNDMPMPSNILDGLLQLVQQASNPDVRHCEAHHAAAACVLCTMLMGKVWSAAAAGVCSCKTSWSRCIVSMICSMCLTSISFMTQPRNVLPTLNSQRLLFIQKRLPCAGTAGVGCCLCHVPVLHCHHTTS